MKGSNRYICIYFDAKFALSWNTLLVGAEFPGVRYKVTCFFFFDLFIGFIGLIRLREKHRY